MGLSEIKRASRAVPSSTDDIICSQSAKLFFARSRALKLLSVLSQPTRNFMSTCPISGELGLTAFAHHFESKHLFQSNIFMLNLILHIIVSFCQVNNTFGKDAHHVIKENVFAALRRQLYDTDIRADIKNNYLIEMSRVKRSSSTSLVPEYI